MALFDKSALTRIALMVTAAALVGTWMGGGKAMASPAPTSLDIPVPVPVQVQKKTATKAPAFVPVSPVMMTAPEVKTSPSPKANKKAPAATPSSVQIFVPPPRTQTIEKPKPVKTPAQVKTPAAAAPLGGTLSYKDTGKLQEKLFPSLGTPTTTDAPDSVPVEMSISKVKAPVATMGMKHKTEYFAFSDTPTRVEGDIKSAEVKAPLPQWGSEPVSFGDMPKEVSTSTITGVAAVKKDLEKYQTPFPIGSSDKAMNGGISFFVPIIKIGEPPEYVDVKTSKETVNPKAGELWGKSLQQSQRNYWRLAKQGIVDPEHMSGVLLKFAKEDPARFLYAAVKNNLLDKETVKAALLEAAAQSAPIAGKTPLQSALTDAGTKRAVEILQKNGSLTPEIVQARLMQNMQTKEGCQNNAGLVKIAIKEEIREYAVQLQQALDAQQQLLSR